MTDTSQEIRDRVRGEALLDMERAGRAPHPDSPAGKGLLASYERWQQSQAAKASDIKAMADLAASLEMVKTALEQATTATAKAQVSPAVSAPEVREETAQRLAEASMRNVLLGGGSVATAVAKGFECYKAKGGRLTLSVWKKATVAL
jgi:hypothetical protein